MYDELDDNLEILKRNNSQYIKFGNQVQFLHIESQKFLGFLPMKSANVEPDNLALELVDEFSDSTAFKLLPVFNYQANNNGLIMNGDEVYIASCSDQAKGNYQPYMNASKLITAHRNADSNAKDVPWREMNISLEQNTSFKLNIFSCYLDNFTDNLKVNDVIGVSYAELGLGFISIGYDDMEHQPGSFAIKEESNKMANLIGNSNGMYRIENFDNDQSGGFLEWGKPYKLRHLS